MSDDLIAEQVAYYRARAAEYDEWWQRRGRYDRGPEFLEQWEAEIAEVASALARFEPGGDVLELAAGTGNWTERLVRHADRVTAVDASEETIAINRERLGGAAVDYVHADVFDWRPPRRFDAVFFSFWLTHVPSDRFEAFWQLVDEALVPEGRFFLLDNRHAARTTAVDQRVDRSGVARRRLNDGREFAIVKVYYEPEELVERLAGLGWEADIRETEEFFVYGWGRRHSGRVRRSGRLRAT